ncbi:MAG TPA: ABC transporter ATP-binding protein [Haliangium sp.]|nr:ABC transporter ATP-binding protein [Haliangium sp.]
MRPARTLSIVDLHKSFVQERGHVPVLSGISVEVQPGELVCILGASGCGKSTLLRVVAGLETPDAGAVSLGGVPLQGPGLDRGLVFQEPRLFPWLDVAQNVAFGLSGRAEAEPAPARDARVAEHLRLVGLSGFERAYPHQLSGGMAQRVALARALVNRPALLLLDEPFGALDALTRAEMQDELLRLRAAERFTALLVTHDIEEAAYLADRVIVMSPRPARVAAIYERSLAHPRDRNGAACAGARAEIASLLARAGAPRDV